MITLVLSTVRTTPCIVSRTPTIAVYHPPTIVAVVVAATATFIVNFPPQHMASSKGLKLLIVSPNLTSTMKPLS